MRIMVSGQAAIGVSTQLELDEREACGMYDGDKIEQAATVNIICHKKYIVANPFPSGVDLMNLATKVVTHFSYRKQIKISIIFVK